MLDKSAQFKFIEFNPRRAARGVEAARVQVTIDDETNILWMSPSDIRKNIKEYGAHEGLQLAHKAYVERAAK